MPKNLGCIVGSGNCLVVFHNFFSPFQSLFKLPKMSIKFMFTPALLKEDNFEYSGRLNQVFNARNINLISIQVKMRVLTCLFKGEKKIIIIIQTKCSSFSAPPLPPSWGRVNGSRVSAESHPHRSTRMRSLQHPVDATKFK